MTTLFQRAALTASYCTNLKVAIEHAFGEYTNNHHHDKDASADVHGLAYRLADSGSISKTMSTEGRMSEFEPPDILSLGKGDYLSKSLQRFNENLALGGWSETITQEDLLSTPVAVLDEIITHDHDNI